MPAEISHKIPANEFHIHHLCVIGVGLIGGSLARALRAAGVCDEITGVGRNTAHLSRAQELGVIDHCATDVAAAGRQADAILVAVPLGAMEEVFQQLRPVLGRDSLLTDAGSAKDCVIEAARHAFGGVPANFIPAHPIAGTEQGGVEASFAELFQNRKVVLTPTATSDEHFLTKAQWLWEQSGADVEIMEAAVHDQVLAATSHLPHVLAYALVDSLIPLDAEQGAFRFAAGGFRDFTRIASSDPTMWRDICLGNREALLTALTEFQRHLDGLKEAIAAGDGEMIKTILDRAKGARDRAMGSEGTDHPHG